MEKIENYLTLKWGTLKSWDFNNSEKGQELLKEYVQIGSSFSAMAQKDTPRQKEIICELIDLCDGDHYSDLISYTTRVASYNHKTNEMSVYGTYSATTMKHINAFLEFYG